MLRSWGQEGSGEPPCDRFARSKIGLCAGPSALVEDHCVHGGGSLGPTIGQLTTDYEPSETQAAAAKGDDMKVRRAGKTKLSWSGTMMMAPTRRSPVQTRSQRAGSMAVGSGSVCPA